MRLLHLLRIQPAPGLPQAALSLMLLAVAANQSGAAQVLFNPLEGTPITSNLDKQDFQSVAPDGFGGAFVVWQDSRNGNIDVYAQRLDENGSPIWAENGIAVVTHAANQSGFLGGGEGRPRVVGDGSGGAIIVWRDERSGGVAADVYAQRLDGSGVPMWTSDGVAIVTAANEQGVPRVIPDGLGGAFIVWEDSRPGGNAIDIYAQRVNAAGTVQWAADGVLVCGAQYAQRGPLLVPDGAGGVIIAWLDLRSPAIPPTYDIYAQRLDGDGTPLWQNDGAAVTRAADDQYLSAMITDDAGGAILVWSDERSSGAGNGDIYAQRINASGQLLWGAGDVAVAAAAAGQTNAVAVSDGAAGVVIAWHDVRAGVGSPDVFAQRVDASGQVQWQSGGLQVSEAGLKGLPVAAAVDGGRTLVVWPDYRNETGSDIYAQIIDSSGVRLAGPNGFAVAMGEENQFRPDVASTGASGIITWIDYKNDEQGDVYVQASSQGPASQDVVEVTGSQVIDLVSTAAMVIDLVNPSGTATIIVERYVGGPAAVNSIGEENVSEYHWVLRAPAGFTFDPSTEVRFRVNNIPDSGILDPTTVQIYKRAAPFSGPSAGSFELVTTSYDATTGELVASGFVSFSQFVLASDANPLPTEHALRVDHLTLDPPAPNPATNLTRIGFTLAAPAHARVIVYDVLGRELIRVVDEFMSAGSHATDIETAGLSGGLYIIRLQVGSASASRSLVVMR